MYKGSNCDRKSQLSEILTEPLNPRERFKSYMLLIINPPTEDLFSKRRKLFEYLRCNRISLLPVR